MGCSSLDCMLILSSIYDLEQGEMSYFVSNGFRPLHVSPNAASIGHSIVYGGDNNTYEEMLFFGGKLKTDYGAGYILTGRNNAWSLNSEIYPNEEIAGSSRKKFAESLSVRSDFKSMVLACNDCTYSTYTGINYIYELVPKFNTWSLSAWLSSPDFDLAYNTEYPTKVAMYDDIIISNAPGTDVKHMPLIGIFMKDIKTHQWSQQQILKTYTSEFDVIDSIAIYEDTIVVGHPLPTGTSLDVALVDSDYVAIFESTPAIPGPKGRPKQWSLSQMLRPPNADRAQSTYGYTVDIEGDNILVTTHAYHTYFYTRDKNQWSQQTKIYAGLDTGFGALKETEAVIGSSQSNFAFHSQNKYWSCLRVTMLDQFGNGWGSARLQVTTPHGDVDVFAPTCQTPHDYTFRYCPSSLTRASEGLYQVKIQNQEVTPFKWEIIYKVFVEYNDEWIGKLCTV